MLEIGTVANQGNQRGGSLWANPRNGGEDETFPATGDNLGHFCFELPQVFGNRIQLPNELLLLDYGD